MKVKVYILASEQGQRALSKLLKTQGLPGDKLFKLKSTMGVIKQALDTYNATKKQIIEEVAMRNEAGEIITLEANQVKISADKVKETEERILQLNESEIEIEPISLKSLGPACQLSVEDLLSLEFIVE